MANQLKMAIVQSILSLHAQRWSYRAIAKRLGVHRETVSRYVRQAAAAAKPAKMHAGKNSRKQAEESSPPEVNSDSTAAAACQS